MRVEKLRTLLVGLFIILLSLSLGSHVSAHQSGCHRWHSCPSDTGSYVCGDLGYTSGCGTTVAPTHTPPAPHVPLITTRSISSDEPIPFYKKIVYTSREYPDYVKITTAGVAGVKHLTTEVSLSDGAETSRKIVGTSVTQQPVTEVTTKGKRLKPTASLVSVKKTNAKDKYDINGRAKPYNEVVLSLDGKRIKRADTNDKGNFSFKAIKITNNKAKIEIFLRKDGKEIRISEPYTVTASNQKITSQYKSLHK